MRGDVEEYIKQCLFRADFKSGDLIPRTYDDSVHGTEDKVLHFDYLYLVPSEVRATVNALDGFLYLLVLSEDLSGFVWLQPQRDRERMQWRGSRSGGGVRMGFHEGVGE